MSDKRRQLRAAVDAALSPLTVADDSESSATFRGVIHAGPVLRGPPGRLHGGLHPAVRLLAPLAKLTIPEAANTQRIALRAPMRKAIPLETDVPIAGRLVRERDSIRITTRVADSDRLDGELRTLPTDASDEVLARFRALLAEDAGTCTRESVTGYGNLVVGVGPGLVRIAVDDAFAANESIHLASFLAEGPSIDPVFTCAILDVLGAFAIGMNLDTLLYTTEIDVVVHGGAPIGPEGFVGLGSRAARDVPGSSIPKVSLRGVEVGEQRVEVLLADATLTRAFGYGFVSLVPVRKD